MLGLLGKGGMGRVWRAWDPQLDRQVAVKEILGDHPELVARFQHEAKAQAKVHHPHVCTVYEVGEFNGRPFIAMELLNGQTLDRVAGDLPVEDLVGIMVTVSEAVHAAHLKGLVHRDIKPANIMVGRTDDGGYWPWVTDFGLAREFDAPGLTISGSTLGTPSYMPPEQARGQTTALDARADVYALGATLFSLVAGRPPFVGENSSEVILKVIQEEPPTLNQVGVKVPKDLESIIVQCLEKDPDRRYSGANELAKDMGRYLRGEPVLARPAGLLLRVGKAIRRRRVISALGVLTLMIAVVLGSAWWRAVLQGRQQAQFAADFDQDIRYVDEIVRHAFTAPLHDVRDELDTARVRLDGLETTIAAAGDLAVGPGHAALGRGYLVLHDYVAARRHFEEAWAAGTRSPEVAVAFGRALAALYRQRRAEVRWKEAEEFEVAIAAAETELRDPALKMLEQGLGAETESPELVEALVASCEERWMDAVQQSAAAHERLPWLYDARVLEGDSWAGLGAEILAIGDNEGAADAFDSAEAAVVKAVSFGRSDPSAFQILCDVGLKRAELGLFGSGGDLERVVADALPACEAAATADPDSVSAPLGKSALWVRLAEWRLERDEDPTEALDKTETAAREALSLAPEDSKPSIRLASAAVLRAQYRMAGDQDPTEELERAVKWFELALDREPSRLEALANLGKAYWLAANWETSQGNDPRGPLDRAVQAYQRAVEVEPENALTRNNLGATWYQRATWEIKNGLDSKDSLSSAVQEFEAARDLNPGLALASLNLGWMYGMQGEQELNRGRNPMPVWDSAVAAYQRCLEIQPDHGEALNRLVIIRLKRAAYLVDVGSDPSEDFDMAVIEAERFLDLRPDGGLAAARLGVALLRRWVSRHGSLDDFERARILLLDCVVTHKDSADPFVELAETLADESEDEDVSRRLRTLAQELRQAELN